MKKQNIKNLFVNGKKIAFMILLAISLNACGSNKEETCVDNGKNVVESKELTPKSQLKTAGEILAFFAVMIGSLCIFVPGYAKDYERKKEAIKKYAERQSQKEQK